MLKNRSLGIILSYVNTIVNMLCGIFLSSFLLKELGDTEYGLYQTVSSFVGYLVLLEFGTGTVMSRNIAIVMGKTISENDRKEELEKNFSTIIIISFVLSALIVAVSAVFYLNIDGIYAVTMTAVQRSYAKKIFLVLVAYLVMTYISQGYDGFLLGVENYSYAKVIGIARTVLRTVLVLAIKQAILIAYIDFGISVCIIIIYAYYVRSYYQMKISIRSFDKRLFLLSVPMCFSLLLQTVINQANSSVDKFIIGVTIDVESVALYSVAQYIFTMFSSMITIPLSMFRPEVAKNVTRGVRGDELTNSLIKPCRITVLIGGAILFGLIAFGKQFIVLLYGADKIIAWDYALVIMIPTFIYMSVNVVLNVLDALNDFLFRSIVLILTTALNIILTIILLKTQGIIGAVIATAISLVLGNIIVMNLYYNRRIGLNMIRLYTESFKGIVPFYAISCVLAFYVCSLIHNNLVSMVVGAIVFLLIGLVPIYKWGMSTNEKEYVNKLLSRLQFKR